MRGEAEQIRLEHSRTARLASGASGETESRIAKRLADATVQLSVDASLPGAASVSRVLLSTLQRQPSQVYLDDRGLDRREVVALLDLGKAIDPRRPVRLGRVSNPSMSVHVGEEERAALRIVPDRHGMRMSREGNLKQFHPPTGLGIMFAAASAAAEIFKTVAQVLPQRRTDAAHVQFCPVALSDDLEEAPMIDPCTIELGLVGLGAVGSATASILSMLPFDGRALLIDPEDFARENLGTYSLGTTADAEASLAKVDIAAKALRNFRCVTFKGRVEAAIARIDSRDLPWPRIVLSGLDSIDARHATQYLWPDLIIDSATGETACGVHVCPDGEACLLCLFPADPRAPSSLERLHDLLGLPLETLAHGDRLLSERDVEQAPVEKRADLRALIGIPICGLARATGLVVDGDGYLPSTPFVSQQAACLGIGRLIARLAGMNEAESPNLVQYDALIGPGSMTAARIQPREACPSVRRRDRVERVREHRSA